jgi:hypothetical protein
MMPLKDYKYLPDKKPSSLLRSPYTSENEINPAVIICWHFSLFFLLCLVLK